MISQGGPRDAAVNFGMYRKLTAASRGFHCDSNAFELNNSINHGKITVLNIFIYCLWILYLTPIVKSSQVVFNKNKWQSHEFYKHDEWK